MIKLEKTEVMGWEAAIRGMRNPMNSWEKSDSTFKETAETEAIDYSENPDGKIEKIFVQFDALGIGPNDHELMMKLVKGGPVHAKYRRMIVVYVDITGPLYWWKEMDTYKIGTTANSCSTMHKIHAKEFTLDDFSCEKLSHIDIGGGVGAPHQMFKNMICMLNECRELFLKTKDKAYWWQMIQLLPSSYNQKRTVMLNYEVLAGIYESRKNHKLDEWREFCKWIEELPYSEIITGGNSDETD